MIVPLTFWMARVSSERNQTKSNPKLCKLVMGTSFSTESGSVGKSVNAEGGGVGGLFCAIWVAFRANSVAFRSRATQVISKSSTCSEVDFSTVSAGRRQAVVAKISSITATNAGQATHLAASCLVRGSILMDDMLAAPERGCGWIGKSGLENKGVRKFI